MRRVRKWTLLLLCLMASISFCQTPDWLSVTSQDLQAKAPSAEPGAPAIQLYYVNWIEHNSTIGSAGNLQSIYSRIKILTDAGRKYGYVEIPVWAGVSIEDLKARTIHPDGSIVEFTGKPLEKTIYKNRGTKVLVKAFFLPDVTVGSIIEYKYTLHYGLHLYPDLWVLQQELYTVKESFRFRPWQRSGGIAWVVSNWKDLNPARKGAGADLDLQDVPAFHTEEYMPPEDKFRATVRFYYLPTRISSSDKYWELMGREWGLEADEFIGNHTEAKEAAAAAMGNEADPEKQLRKLYARAQEIRNLSYERPRTEKERKDEELKPNHNVADVLTRGYGYGADIAAAFVAMARAAGFEAWVVRVSNRQNGFFEKETLSPGQLRWEIAEVKLKGTDIFLDPGTRFCPFGLLRWGRTSTDAMRLDKNGGAFLVTPAALQNKAVISRNVTATLSQDGTLKGDVQIEFYNTDALEHRLDALETDDAGRRKSLENEFKAALVAEDATVTLKEVKGWDGTDEPLVATLSFEIPSYASLAGKRLIIPSYLFRLRQKNAFTGAERKYPVYFPTLLLNWTPCRSAFLRGSRSRLFRGSMRRRCPMPDTRTCFRSMPDS